MVGGFRWHTTDSQGGGSTSPAHPAASRTPGQRPSHTFVTLDAGLRMERRRDHARRARVDGVLRTIEDPRRRSDYLASIRASRRSTAA